MNRCFNVSQYVSGPTGDEVNDEVPEFIDETEIIGDEASEYEEETEMLDKEEPEYLDEESLEMEDEELSKDTEMVDEAALRVKRARYQVSIDGKIVLRSKGKFGKSYIYECEHCRKTYTWATSLSRHRRECKAAQTTVEQEETPGKEEEDESCMDQDEGLDAAPTMDDELEESKNALEKFQPRYRELIKYKAVNGVYTCWDCGKPYQWASSLSRHRTIECGPKNKKRYVCSMCCYRTGYKGNFMRHLKSPRHAMNSRYRKCMSKVANQVSARTIEHKEDNSSVIIKS